MSVFVLPLNTGTSPSAKADTYMPVQTAAEYSGYNLQYIRRLLVSGAIEGVNAWQFSGQESNPYEQEHADLIQSIRDGKPLNEGRQVAESTLAAIMGRMAAYTGRTIQWDWAMSKSQLDLFPKDFKEGVFPVEPVAKPGETDPV